MFWKRAEHAATDPSTARLRQRSWSIVGRLTLLYTVAACGMLILAVGFLYWTLARDLARDGQQFLADQIHVLRTIVRERPDVPAALEEEVKWEEAAHQFAKYYARVLDAGGHTLLETPGMHDIVTASVFPAPIAVRHYPEGAIKWRSPQGSSYLLIAAWAEGKHDDPTRRLLQVALDVSPDEALLADYRRTLLIVLLAAIACSTCFGITITRKGLRPLHTITTSMQRMSAAQLHERIAASGWPQELTTLAAAFNKMLDRLENAFARLSQFSAELAHELRTPINNLMGEAEVALLQHRTPAEYRQVIESNLEEYARLARLTENLLFLARAENPHTTVERSQFDTRKVLETVREFHEAIAKEKGITVSCQGEALVFAAPMLFRQAVSNLLSNALHHTPCDGRITLAVSQSDNQSTVIQCRDTGCGIAPEHLPNVFDRFYRGDSARAHHPQGAGLGLAIVKSIMELHGGTATVQNNSPTGTTVTLTFPPAVAYER